MAFAYPVGYRTCGLAGQAHETGDVAFFFGNSCISNFSIECLRKLNFQLNLTHRYKTQTCLSGNILLSHPNLKDPNFYKSVVFLSAHPEESGSIGVILNRPMNRTLEELDDQFKGNPYGSIPVYEGGPVEKDKIIVAAWEWMKESSSFKLYFGIDLEKVDNLAKDSEDVKLPASRPLRLVTRAVGG